MSAAGTGESTTPSEANRQIKLTIDMTSDTASLTAFLVAPLVPALAVALSSPGLGGGLDADVARLVPLALFLYLFAIPLVALPALPVFLFLRRRDCAGFGASLGSGTVLGAAMAAILRLPVTEPMSAWFVETAPAMPFMASLGAATGVTFWAVRSACLRWSNAPAERSA